MQFPGPAKIAPGSKYSIDFAVAVVSDKYEYHLPLERQRRKMEAAGLSIDVKTLYRLCEQVAKHCESVMEPIRTEIMDEFCAVHLDETPWKIQGKDSNGYIWSMSNRSGTYYRFEPSRSGKVQEELLVGYSGAIVTDAYSGYNSSRKSKNIRVGHCWSHARREFFDRWDDFPNHCGYAIELIDMLFDVESEAKSFEELIELRKTKSKSIVNELESWMKKTRGEFLKEESISKAINYCFNHWKELTLFLRDISVPLSNNDAKRALRHAVMGRKNFLGSKTINGADVATTLYTVIESCKKVSIQPAEYLRYLVAEKWEQRQPESPRGYAFKVKKLKEKEFPHPDSWEF